MSEDRSRHHRDDTGMLEALGFVGTDTIDRDTGQARLKFRAALHHCNNSRVVQGGFVTAWLDCAMSSAVFVYGGKGTTLVSLEIKTVYYGPIPPDAEYVVEGSIDRVGSKTAFLEGQVIDGAGRVLAKATSSASIRMPARAAPSA